MASGQVRTRSRAEIEAMCRQPHDSASLRGRVLEALRRAVDFGSHGWLPTDPVTTVDAAPIADVPCAPA